MRLSELIQMLEARVPEAQGADPEISGLHYRAQSVGEKGVFFAIPGFRSDGHRFIDEAVSRGAAAVVAERAGSAPVPVIRVDSSRKALGRAAAAYYGRPADAMVMIGITGTNGKTTTAYLLESALLAAGHRPGVIGTIDYRYAENSYPNPVTTPESLDVQRILAEMRDAGATHVVMEASSHGLALERLTGCRFDVGIFTNLTQDHLDFHETMDAYWASKRRLFDHLLRTKGGRRTGWAVVNVDDPKGVELKNSLPGATIGVGVSEDADIGAEGIACDRSGIRGTLSLLKEKVPFASPLVGRHNLENILCAAGASAALDISAGAVRRGVASLAAVPGRLEPVTNETGRFVYVDYAHTPDALDNVLRALRELSGSRIISVFGCGGDRDRSKRPLMGRIAVSGSDLSVVTSDNPRSEDPDAIIADILDGVRDAGIRYYRPADLTGGFEAPGWTVMPDRAGAIRLAVEASRPGDTLLIAGKGHETYQILKDRTIDFDDRSVAAEALGMRPKKVAAT